MIDLAKFYDPLDHQLAFHKARPRTNGTGFENRLQVGGAGSGKSLALLWEALTYCIEYPGSQNLLIRKNYPELEKGLIRDLLTSVPRDLYKWNDQKHTATLRNGSILFMGHCEENEKSLGEYLSSAFVFIGLDEMGQFSFSVWDFLVRRNRVNMACQPHHKSGKMPIPCMAGATNPHGVGWAWIKSLFIDHKPIPQLGNKPNYKPEAYWFIHSTIMQNTYQLERDPGYVERLKTGAPELVKIFFEGDINTVAGAYYANFTPDHVVDLQVDPGRIEWQNWQPSWIGLDWGLAHYCVALWFTQALVRCLDGTRRLALVCYREMIINETDIEDAAKLIFEMTSGTPILGGSESARNERKNVKRIYVSHELFGRRRSPRTDQTIAAGLSRALMAVGFPACERAKGSATAQERIDGAVLIHQHITSADLIFSTGYHDAPDQLVRAIPLLARDPKDIEDVAKSNGIEDDLFDALKHGVLSYLWPAERPKVELIREQAEQIQDPWAKWNYLRANLPKAKPQVRVHQEVRPRWQIE